MGSTHPSVLCAGGAGLLGVESGARRPARIEALEARVTFLEKAMLVRQPTDEEAPSPPD